MANELGNAGCLFTVGHSNHTLEVFLGLLTRHAIEVLIDTRSSPFSRFAPHFNQASLKEAVEATGMKYGFYGRPLGGRPENLAFYDTDGHVLYSEVAKSSEFRDGIARLRIGLTKYRTALLCSEENPSVCHRRLLVSRVLFESGVDIRHIRGTGAVVSEGELRREEELLRSRQRGLFDNEEDDEKAVPWKSIQSVLHKARQPTFSDD